MATIKVMSGGAPKEVFAQLTPDFEKRTGHKVVFAYAVMSALRDRLAAGEAADILVMPVPLLDGYAKEGRLRADGRCVLGTVLISMVARSGVPQPDIATAAKFRQSLLDARSVVHATPGATPSGTHMGKLMTDLGIAEAMAAKVVHRPALEGGVDLVRTGAADLGIYPTSEVVNIDGLTVVGPLPGELQLPIVYGAGVTADNGNAEAAKAFIAFLTAPEHAAAWAAGGFEGAGG
jgi:molybdate transport system substrate-binding protein